MNNFQESFEELFNTWESLSLFKIPDGVIENRKSLGFYFDSWSGAIVWSKENEVESAYCLMYHRFIGEVFYRLIETGEIIEEVFPSYEDAKMKSKFTLELYPNFFRCNNILDNYIQSQIGKGDVSIYKNIESGHLQFWFIIENEG